MAWMAVGLGLVQSLLLQTEAAKNIEGEGKSWL